MALDFHRLDNNQHLFGLDNNNFNLISEIFETFRQLTGIFIDQYGDTELSIEKQKILITIIDEYVEKTNLNHDKQKTVAILEFRGLLKLFTITNCDLELIGD